MNVKTSHIIGIATLVAAAAAPLVVMAQSAGVEHGSQHGSSQQTGSMGGSQQGSSMQGSQQGSSMGSEQGSSMGGQQGSSMQGSQQGGAMQPARGGGQQAGAGAMRTVAINGHFTFPLSAGCNYTADVRGTARQVRGAAASEPMFTPDVTINASVACPNQTTINVREMISGQRELTLTQLEEQIELRASLVTETTGAHCAYVPNFRLTQRALEGVSAALLCPLPAQAARGGGPMEPSQDQNTPGPRPIQNQVR